jgi:hypothetical protein
MPEFKDWVSLAAAIIALGGLGYYTWQYRTAQQWKRAEFVASQMRDLESNPLTYNALRMLDTQGYVFTLGTGDQQGSPAEGFVVDKELLMSTFHVSTDPENDLAGDNQGSGAEGFVVDNERLGSNVRVSTDAEKEREVRIRAMRNSFDHFFDTLERFNAFIDTRLVPTTYFKPYLAFWLELLGRPSGRFACLDQDLREEIWTYLVANDYSEVQKLFKKYGRDITPRTSTPTQNGSAIGQEVNPA